MSSCTTTTSNSTAVQGSQIKQQVGLAAIDFNHRSADYLKIQVTPSATDKIADRLLQNKSALGVRISIVTKGCSGLSYKMEYAENMLNITEKDEVINLANGAKIFIDPKSCLFLFNTHIGYESNGIESGFKFSNPNSKGSCGCGESFFV